MIARGTLTCDWDRNALKRASNILKYYYKSHLYRTLEKKYDTACVRGKGFKATKNVKSKC